MREAKKPTKNSVCNRSSVGQSSGFLISGGGGDGKPETPKQPKNRPAEPAQPFTASLTGVGLQPRLQPLVIGMVDGAKRYSPTSAVYFLATRAGKVVYVGSSKNLSVRLSSHPVPRRQYSHVFYIPVEASEREFIERVFITIFCPRHNFIDGVLWAMNYPERWLDTVVDRYFLSDWTNLPPRHEILSRRTTPSLVGGYRALPPLPLPLPAGMGGER